MNVPYDIKNTAMDDTIKTITLEPEWNSASIGMREDTIPFLVYNNAETRYRTIPAGQSFNLGSHNLSAGNSVDIIKIKAASGTLEILGFKRN